ncbi:kinase-like domain-containing protein, partial [Mrakia frigida]|uniref:kinase-like domain-containing protein n=1 Tax=Mrakia frigida TaxID=29902 RepID=UPI003FCBF9E8
QRISQEIALWSSLSCSHPHLVPLLSHHSTPHASYLFMPFMPNGSLFDYVKRHREHDRGRLFKGVVEGLRWLHKEEGVVHGDLKAENVLIDAEGRCRIADFGLANPSPSPSKPKPKPTYAPNLSSVHRAHTISSPHPRLASSPFPSSRQQQQQQQQQRPPSPPTFPPGSLPYASPELLRPPSHSSHGPSPISPAQDIWSLGVLLFFLLTSGTLPFQDAFEPRLQMKIVRGLWELPEGIVVGKQAEEVLKGCLEVEVKERWGVEEVGTSEWVQGW